MSFSTMSSYLLTRIKQTTMRTTKKNGSAIRIADYSEKAFVVRGDTKPIKDKLKTLGGRFNPYLKDGNGSFAGWVFSKKKQSEVARKLKGIATV